MTEINQNYKCLQCGNIVEVLGTGNGTLTCCEKPMMMLRENTQEAAVEKHIPIISRENNGVKVVVGEIEHPMTEDHWIEWVEVITAKKTYRHDFRPGEKPECFFEILDTEYRVRAYCNLHGLWTNQE
jgi:superoxide reductase